MNAENKCFFVQFWCNEADNIKILFDSKRITKNVNVKNEKGRAKILCVNKGNKLLLAGLHDKVQLLNIQPIFQLQYPQRLHIGNRFYQKVKLKYMLCERKSDNI